MIRAAIKVLIVDDHELVRQGIARMLADVEGIKIVAEAPNAEEALKLIKLHEPHVVLMDIKMPGMGGMEATKKIARQYPEVRVIIVTICEEEPFPSRLMSAGAAGYITKGAPLHEMVRAIKSAYSGQRYISPDIAQVLALKKFSPGHESPFDHLSERELQIAMMIVNCRKVSDISDQLFLSPKTVNSYRYRLFEKLGINSDVELALLAVRHGMLDAEAIA